MHKKRADAVDSTDVYWFFKIHTHNALFLEGLIMVCAVAGLLTYPRFEQPSHIYNAVAIELSKRCIGFTVAGLFRIFT
jgi:hypothetical protein